jgi:general nucleoside transport system permease protein
MTLGGWHVRLEERVDAPPRLRWFRPALSVAAALVLGAVLLLAAGLDPILIYGHILNAAFGSAWGWSDTLVKATPIMLCGLGVAVAFRMRLWNIGAEGQLWMGAWAASGVALGWLPAGTPRALMLIAMAVAGASAGAAWGAIPGWLKARLGVSEIITTLMLNYVAFQWVAWFVFGPWSEGGFQLTPQFPANAWLPRLSDASGMHASLSGLTVHAGLVLALLAAVAVTFLLDHSRWGFEIKVTGDGVRAARHAGMPIARNTVLALALTGGLAGLAGMSEVAGVVHRLQDRFSPGFGFTAIIVAWLAGLRPWAVVVVSVLFGGLLVGGKDIQPAGIPQMLQGLVLLVIVSSEGIARYRLRVSREQVSA